MSTVVIDMTMSLDGFVAGPDDGKTHPLGTHDGMRIFDWYFSGTEDVSRHELFRPEPGANLDQVKLMFEETGAFIFGRRTYEITNGWGGRHPVNGPPVFVLTHSAPAARHRAPGALRRSRSSPTASPAPSSRRARSPAARTSSSVAPHPGSRR